MSPLETDIPTGRMPVNMKTTFTSQVESPGPHPSFTTLRRTNPADTLVIGHLNYEETDC
jgi:hypothetical protein